MYHMNLNDDKTKKIFKFLDFCLRIDDIWMHKEIIKYWFMINIGFIILFTSIMFEFICFVGILLVIITIIASSFVELSTHDQRALFSLVYLTKLININWDLCPRIPIFPYTVLCCILPPLNVCFILTNIICHYFISKKIAGQ